MSSGVPMRPAGMRAFDLVAVVARVLVHVGGEGARRDRADHDALVRQPQRHAAREVDQAGLAGGVRVGFLRVDRHAVDRGDVDHLGQVVGRGLPEHRRQRLRQEEGRLQVQVDHLVPAAFRKFVERRAPGGAGVVDQDVERALVLGVGLDQRLRAVERRHVGRQRDAVAEGRQLLGGLVAGRGLARRDVDARALRQEAFGDHAADAARAAGDERAAALEREESGGVHGVSVSGSWGWAAVGRTPRMHGSAPGAACGQHRGRPGARASLRCQRAGKEAASGQGMEGSKRT